VIPDYQTIMSPLLQVARDGSELSTKDAIGALADRFALSDEERESLLPSGSQKTFANRVGWALTYLKKAGLLRATRRAHFAITPLGTETLATRQAPINNAFLAQFESFAAFRDGSSDAVVDSVTPAATSVAAPVAELETPELRINSALRELESVLVDELLGRVRAASWQFFEKLVIQVLIAMGYGDGVESGTHLGRSGDGGVDGLINEDELGLEQIYVQAKHWQNKVGSPDLHQFVGALSGQRASKGVFITTSEFTADAKSYIKGLGSHRIILIDGERLARLMIKHGVGVQVVDAIQIKRIDSDYFPEEELA
jgi:restriction system protein